MACTWIFSAAAPMTMEFLEFTTESNYDFVKVYDGGSQRSLRLGSLSGSNIPAAISSSAGQMSVFFIADRSVQGTGFVARITAQQETRAPTPSTTQRCSSAVELQVSSQPLTLSDGPGFYGPSSVCAWIFTAIAPITIQFSSFQLENNYDYVFVYDGGTAESPELGRFTGNSAPAPIRSTGFQMTLVLQSDSSVQGDGFVALVSASSGTPTPSSPLYFNNPPVSSQTGADTTSRACSGTVMLAATVNPTVITDGPGQYASDMVCTWIFSSAGPITVEFNLFATERGFDFVHVYDGGSTTAPRIQSFSGTEVRPVTSTRNQLTISFTSDNSVEAAGFFASVNSPFGTQGAISPAQAPIQDTSLSVPCAGTVVRTVTATPLRISDGPGDYASSRTCTWVLNAAAGLNKIKIQFSTFVTENGFDFVNIYRSTTAVNANKVMSLTGQRGGAQADVDSAVAMLVFTADGSMNMAGFEAMVSARLE
jgi:hypothetical protein